MGRGFSPPRPSDIFEESKTARTIIPPNPCPRRSGSLQTCAIPRTTILAPATVIVLLKDRAAAIACREAEAPDLFLSVHIMCHFSSISIADSAALSTDTVSHVRSDFGKQFAQSWQHSWRSMASNSAGATHCRCRPPCDGDVANICQNRLNMARCPQYPGRNSSKDFNSVSHLAAVGLASAKNGT